MPPILKVFTLVYLSGWAPPCPTPALVPRRHPLARLGAGPVESPPLGGWMHPTSWFLGLTV